MSLKLIEIFAAPSQISTVADIAKQFGALGFWKDSASANETATCRIVARPEKQQDLIDQLQDALDMAKPWRITIMPIEATIPELEETKTEGPSAEQVTREELYTEIDRGARIDSTFVLLVILSTVVAAIGLLENNVTIVIAAMLIAPLLGPNIAMAFGSTLGDRELVIRGAVTNAAGIALSIGCAAAVGLALPADATAELMGRTELGYDNILLALASGAAGALSLQKRLSSTLVGVMVGVALLPPAATLGYMLGTGQFQLAAGAASLLGVNIVCLNLSAQLVFISKGMKPRTWLERRAAKESVIISLAVTGILLAILIAVIYWQHR